MDDHSDLLRAEDLPMFERVLDRALSAPAVRERRRRTLGALNGEQLRTRALGARAAISASAAPEYRAYRQLLDASAPSGTGRNGARRESGIGATVRGSALHAVAVLVPGLSVTAAVVFGLIGFGFRAVDRHSHLAEVMLLAGAVAVGVAVVTVLAGLVGLLVAAARNRSAPGGVDPEVERACEAWQGALLERGMLPFLVEAIGPADRDAAARPDATARADAADGMAGTEPTAGAAAAGAAAGVGAVGSVAGGPTAGAAGVPQPRRRPGFSAPDFSSPDFSGPDFSGPDFSGPDYRGPALPGSD
ncbi:hypothetical protein [Streptomyces sp. NPDC056061]|uniref:hypothetical protein n=1 Tax=Streptomyces sp. NPDC056061 TaxID=3345700 RepID=UPI0035E1EFA1